MSIRYKTNRQIGRNSFKAVGALMVMAVTIAGAQENPAPAEATVPAEATNRDSGFGNRESTSGKKPAPKTEKPSTEPSSQPSTPDPQLPSALELLREARLRLDNYRTLKAKMVELIEFGPRRFKAEGIYLQGTDHRLRLDLSVTLEKSTGRLLQICEGDILYTIYDIGETPRITRRDITQILAAADQAGVQRMVAQDLGLGGLPALLAAAEQSMDFDPPIAATIEGRKFYVIQGSWKSSILERFQQQAQSLPTPTEEPRPLPEHVPDFMRIYLDAETLFPYRIRYLKLPPNPGGEPRPLLTLDFQDIVVNAAIDPTEFRYSAPDGANVVDLTNYYLQKLRGAPAPTPPK